MLVIRQDQMRALKLLFRGSFVEEMEVHLRRCFPTETAAMTSAGLRTEIHRAMDTAESFGLTSRQDICRFLNLSIFLGWEFLDCPENQWMRAHLAGPGPESPGERLKKLQNRLLFEIEFRRVAESAVRR